MVYNISHKTLIRGAKPLRIRFDKIDEFIRVYDGLRYLVLFGSEKYHAIYNRIRYLISQKIKIYSYDSLPKEKTLTLHNVVTHTKSVLNKDQNHYYHNMFLEKYLYKLAKK